MHQFHFLRIKRYNDLIFIKVKPQTQFKTIRSFSTIRRNIFHYYILTNLKDRITSSWSKQHTEINNRFGQMLQKCQKRQANSIDTNHQIGCWYLTFSELLDPKIVRFVRLVYDVCSRLWFVSFCLVMCVNIFRALLEN